MIPKLISLTMTGLFLLVFWGVTEKAYAMHIMEGFLPAKWALFWFIVTLPFFLMGIRSIKLKVQNNHNLKLLLGVAGAFAFVLSALKIPSVTGSCSHPTGVGLGAILFGPTAMTVLGVIVLLFQALLLTHGGITTLGANAFSMAVAGPFVAYGIYKASQKMGLPLWLSVFLAAALGDLCTYIITSIQLGLAFPDAHGGIVISMMKFLGIFAITQIPLALSEGLITVMVFNALKSYSSQEMTELSVINKEA